MISGLAVTIGLEITGDGLRLIVCVGNRLIFVGGEDFNQLRNRAAPCVQIGLRSADWLVSTNYPRCNEIFLDYELLVDGQHRNV